MTEFNIPACVDLMRRADKAIQGFIKGPRMPDYTIGGGALRDTLLGFEVSDIDVLVRNVSDFGFEAKDGFSADQQDYVHGGGVRHVRDLDLEVDGYPVQIIERTREIGILPSDVAFYHIAYLSDVFWRRGALTITEGFVRDATDQVIRIKPNERDPASNRGYVDKLRAKLGWPVEFERDPSEDILG